MDHRTEPADPPAPVRGDGARVRDSLALTWCLALVPHVIAVVQSVVSVARGHRPGNLVDFLGASGAMLAGRDIYAGGTGGYVYPPLIAFLYQPLAMIPERSAAFVALAVNAALSVFTLVLVSRVLVRRLTGRVDPLLVARVALFGAWCTVDKIKAEFYHVETNVLMLLAFTAAMRWVDRRPRLSGLALGFAFNVKYWPVVLVPYLLARRRWRAVGWFAVWAVVFALVPALSMGWRADGRAWAEASGGLLKLFGVDVGLAGAAHLRPITDAVSLSVTSGLARVTGLPSPVPLALAAGVGLLFCGYAVATYARNELPVLSWPPVVEQAAAPFCGLLTIEWMGVLLLTLIFSPFTNSRHLYMLLDVNIAAGVLLLGTGGLVPRWPLAIATACMFVGITCPFSHMSLFGRSLRFWPWAGGPAWCMLCMYAALIWTNVRYQRSAGVSRRVALSTRVDQSSRLTVA